MFGGFRPDGFPLPHGGVPASTSGTSDVGAFVISGKAARLLYNRLVKAAVGAFVISGKAARLLYNRLLRAISGAAYLLLPGSADNQAKASLIFDFVDKPSIVPTVGSATIAVTRSGATATRVNESGVIEVVAANTARLNHDPVTLQCKGLLNEDTRKNSIRNNTMQGVVAGSPGTPPTNWDAAPSGLTRTIVGSGKLNGIEYVDIRFQGTTGSTFGNVGFEPVVPGVAASAGQTWTNSVYVALVGGSMANVSNFKVRIACFTSIPTYLGEVTGSPVSLSLTSTMQRFATTGAALASTATIQPYIQGAWNAGVAVDFTLRIGLPQLELGYGATSVIKTTSAEVTRNADDWIVSTLSPWFNASEGTLFAEYDLDAMPPAGIWPGVAAFRNGVDASALGFYAQASTGSPTFHVRSPTPQAGIAVGTGAAGQVVRIVGSYAANDFAAARDGTLGTPDTSGTVPTLDRLWLGRYDNYLNGHLRRFIYFPKRLLNATDVSLSSGTPSFTSFIISQGGVTRLLVNHILRSGVGVFIISGVNVILRAIRLSPRVIVVGREDRSLSISSTPGGMVSGDDRGIVVSAEPRTIVVHKDKDAL